MIVALTAASGSLAGRRFPIGDTARIGAAAEAEVRVRLDGVSGRHARLWREGDAYWIEDVGSANGTFLNGKRIQRGRIRHLDVVTLGRLVDLVFVCKSGEAPVSVGVGIIDAVLEPLDGPDRGTPFDIGKGETTLGRAEACTLVVDNAAISKVHARIQRTPDQVTVQDLGSLNGTFVNGTRITAPTPLMTGDTLSIGSARSFAVTVTRDAASAPAMTPSPATTSAEPVFDQEWKTRMVWSAEEMAELEAARQKAIDSRPRTAALPAPAKDQPVAPAKPKPSAVATPPPPQPSPAAATGPLGQEPLPLAEGPARALPVPVMAPAIPAAPPAEKPVVTNPAVNPPAPAVNERSIRELRLNGPTGNVTVGQGRHVLGRGADAGVRVDVEQLSRAHAVLTVSPLAVTVVDHNSANGTYVNGTEVTAPHALQDGDRVAFGPVEFVVELVR